MSVVSPAFPDLTTTYTVALTRLAGTTKPLSDDATLSALSLTGIDIGTFSSDDYNYSYTLDYYDSLNGLTTTVATAGTNSGATWKISPEDADPETGGHQVAVNGDDTITVAVVSQDGAVRRTYTVSPGRRVRGDRRGRCDPPERA